MEVDEMTGGGKLKYSEESLHQCHFIRHRQQIDFSDTEPGS